METISEMPETIPFSLSENWIIIILLMVASLAGIWIYNRFFANSQIKNHGQDDPSNMNYCEGDKCYL